MFTRRLTMIEVENLTRVFRTYKKQPGFWGGVKGLFKREFEETRAADNVSFSIKEGEFVGFLGPNGAGKTTTLKMLSGLIYPTSGTARVAGFDPSKRENAYRRLFALVLGIPGTPVYQIFSGIGARSLDLGIGYTIVFGLLWFFYFSANVHIYRRFFAGREPAGEVGPAVEGLERAPRLFAGYGVFLMVIVIAVAQAAGRLL